MIDLHVHTTESDGTVTPEAVVQMAVDKGLEAISITDHDTLAGYERALPLANMLGLELLCGIELSTRPPTMRDSTTRVPSVHLLGYFLDDGPTTRFRDWILWMQKGRHNRNLALIDRLNALGLQITMQEVKAIGSPLISRNHFAHVLVQKQYVSSLRQAFELYLGDGAEASVEREEPSLEEGIRQIRLAGGIPSLAHPVRIAGGRDAAVMAQLLPRLMAGGLLGIEVYHCEHTAADMQFYRSLATEFGLMITGGSDFHGQTKPSVFLGVGSNNISIPYSILKEMRAHASQLNARAAE